MMSYRTRAAASGLTLIVLFVGGAPPRAAAPDDTYLSPHGLTLGARAHGAGIPGDFVSAAGAFYAGATCRWSNASGGVEQRVATNVPGPAPQTVLGPPGTWPQTIGREGDLVTLADATCESTLPIVAVFDLSTVDLGGQPHWRDLGRFARFADGTVLYPALVASSVGSMALVALDPSDASARLFWATDAIGEVYTSHPYDFSALTTGPDDRIYALLNGKSGSGLTTGLVALSRDGSLDVVLTAEDWGYQRLHAASRIFYFPALDAMAVAPVEPQLEVWHDAPLMALFPLGSPRLGAAPRAPWLRLDDVWFAAASGPEALGAGVLATVVAGEGGPFVAVADDLRPLGADPAIVDADRDGLARADEGEADWERPVAGDPPTLVGASTELLQMPFFRGHDSVGEGGLEGPLYCGGADTGDNSSHACVSAQGHIVAEMRGPLSHSTDGGLFGPDGDVFDQDTPATGILRWDADTQTAEPFATLEPAGTRVDGFVALSRTVVLGIQHEPRPIVPVLTRYEEGQPPFIVIDPHRPACPVAANAAALTTCDDLDDPIVRRVRAELATPGAVPYVRFTYVGRGPESTALFELFGGSIRSFVVAVGVDSVTFFLDGMDRAGSTFQVPPAGSWGITEGTVLDGRLLPFADYSEAVEPGPEWHVGPWFGRGFMTGRFELVVVPEAVQPGEAILFNAPGSCRVSRSTARASRGSTPARSPR